MSTTSAPAIPASIVAILGASMIAVTPVAAPLPPAPAPVVQLASMADFFTEGLGLDNLVGGLTSGSIPDQLAFPLFDPSSGSGVLDSIIGSTDLPDLDSVLTQVFSQFGSFGPILDFVFTGPLGAFFQPLLLMAIPLILPIVLPTLLSGLGDGPLPLPDLPDGTTLLPDLINSFGDLSSVGLGADTAIDPAVVSDLVSDFAGTNANGDLADLGAALPELLSTL